MTTVLRILIYIVLGLPVGVVLYLTIVRIVRHFYKFPMPEFLANVIDNPLRRKIQPPDGTPARHGIEPGMVVLEVGPGSGTYTIAAARRVGDNGRVITIDIEPRIVERHVEINNAISDDVPSRFDLAQLHDRYVH